MVYNLFDPCGGSGRRKKNGSAGFDSGETQPCKLTLANMELAHALPLNVSFCMQKCQNVKILILSCVTCAGTTIAG